MSRLTADVLVLLGYPDKRELHAWFKWLDEDVLRTIVCITNKEDSSGYPSNDRFCLVFIKKIGFDIDPALKKIAWMYALSDVDIVLSGTVLKHPEEKIFFSAVKKNLDECLGGVRLLLGNYADFGRLHVNNLFSNFFKLH